MRKSINNLPRRIPMDWQTQLVSIYFIVSKIWAQGLGLHLERESNNRSRLTDEEVLTIFLFGIISGHRTVKAIYWHTRNHLPGWFPDLKGYEAYNYRLGKLGDVCPIFLEALLNQCTTMKGKEIRRMIDSFPIIMAKEKRSNNGKVAPQLASKGYCSSRGEYYYGVKGHIVGINRDGRIPIPESIQITPASTNDLTLLKAIGENSGECNLYADKAYIDSEFNKLMEDKNGVKIITPIKKPKGGDLSYFEKLYSSSVSGIRQPIESLFNWINEKTGLQVASKVRSEKGLFVHIFGRLAASVFLMLVDKFNF